MELFHQLTGEICLHRLKISSKMYHFLVKFAHHIIISCNSHLFLRCKLKTFDLINVSTRISVQTLGYLSFFEAFLRELALNQEFTGEKISPWLTMVNRWLGESISYSTLLLTPFLILKLAIYHHSGGTWARCRNFLNSMSTYSETCFEQALTHLFSMGNRHLSISKLI